MVGIEKIMARIQIFTVLGKNGIMFANFLRKTILQLSSGDHEFSFNCFMSSEANPPEHWEGLEYILKQEHTSLNHTTGLNRIIDYIDGDYVIVTDADVALLIPQWENLLIRDMNRRGIDILGVDHWDHPRGYRGFPIVTFFITKSSAFLKAQPDFRPSLTPYRNQLGTGAKEITIRTAEEVYLFGRPKGKRLLQDSGWQLPICYKKASLRGEVLQKASTYAFDNQVPQVWKIGKQLGVCHKGKSSKRRQSKALKFFKSISAYIEQTHGISII
ncbi:MAG: glycosyltransferase family A protein [Promethearchaeota archaeon]|jgi:hypothetical protein